MNAMRTFTVVPALPAALARLRELSNNLWWCWNSDARELFRRLDPDLWNEVAENPVRLLSLVSQKRLDQAANDTAFRAHLTRVMAAFDAYLGGETWFSRRFPALRDATVAYFSMEFGVHDSLPLYAGGLGVLAGDHLKSASDLGVPLVGVGLLYRQGYFHQRLANDGWQLEEYPLLDVHQVPITQVTLSGGEPLLLRLPLAERHVTIQVWKLNVGRVPVYLLDTELPTNDPRDREITHRLYAGDADMRIRQEVVLGIGGPRVLEQLGITPDAYHMNEGHSAFLAIERIRQRMTADGLDYRAAREAVVPSHAFTTHTPVPAGIDTFEPSLLMRYLAPFLSEIGLALDEFLGLGRAVPGNGHEPLNMAVLALRLSGAANGVSALHGHVSRQMWQEVWTGAPRDEVPIGSITNGIHVGSWMSAEMSDLMHRYLGPHWAEDPVDHGVWLRISEIPDIELWRAHERRRVALVAFARRRVREQHRRRGAAAAEVKLCDELLDPEALTVCFARRFAPYKRGALLFRNPDRLKRILNNDQRPVQIIFAGKAHPRDRNGKEIIKQIMTHVRQPDFRRRMVFIEDYDIAVARPLVQGADVWLNNPVKPREASGTSGMKVGPNGGLNMSVLDGWWPEAYDGENGWAIGDGQIYEDPEYQDYVEGEAIYDLLEKEVVPMFYERGSDGVPRRWVARMKASMRTVCPMFNTNRMLEEYATRIYAPAMTRWRHLSRDAFAGAKALAAWKQALAGAWREVRIEHVEARDGDELRVGAHLEVHARVHLGAVKPRDVAVELFHGRIDAAGQLVDGASDLMDLQESLDGGRYSYAGKIPCVRSGGHRYAVRVVPRHPDLVHRFDSGLILWG